jgi:hypothetical protein
MYNTFDIAAECYILCSLVTGLLLYMNLCKGFCYVVFNSHIFNATEVQLSKWCFHLKFVLFMRPIMYTYMCGAPKRLSAFGACTFLVLAQQRWIRKYSC